MTGPGLTVLAGFTAEDTSAVAMKLARKLVDLRIFEDAEGKMNRSVHDLGGTVLAISQFTLYADTRRGRRPSFDTAARPEFALPLYEALGEAITAAGVDCERGVFGAHMELVMVNDGPVTIIIDSDDLERPRRT